MSAAAPRKIQGLELRHEKSMFSFGRQLALHVAFVNDAQTIEGEILVDFVDELRPGRDQRRETAGGDHLRAVAHFLEQPLEDAVDEPEVSVIETALQRADRIGPDDG